MIVATLLVDNHASIDEILTVAAGPERTTEGVREALESAARAKEVKPAADRYREAARTVSKLGAAMRTLQGESGHINKGAQEKFSSLVETICEAAAEGKIDRKALTAVGTDDAVARGLNLVTLRAGIQLVHARVARLRARVRWLFAVRDALEVIQQEHEAKVQLALGAVSEVDGEAANVASPNSISAGLIKHKAELSKRAEADKRQADQIERDMGLVK